MTYPQLVVPFLAVAVVVWLGTRWWLRRRDPSAAGLPSVRATAWTFAAVAVMTAVFDNVMIAAGLVAYDDSRLSGLRLGLAPVEDFAYPLAGVLLLPALWHLLTPRARAA